VGEALLLGCSELKSKTRCSHAAFWLAASGAVEAAKVGSALVMRSSENERDIEGLHSQLCG